ncbi:M56 family metallopeptidase [Paenibacillus flagellatus]|uniref:Peptidase M56 n=1 Tax=Paenibacillus flagellatus TaxID=2211139 RepID=A0A2V5K275_9BACL|nr:M56 family metallopeptidase [Paenibacillus flagellatus]PYI51864.1 peptidase M56 [Paenibacillus flagellatus]
MKWRIRSRRLFAGSAIVAAFVLAQMGAYVVHMAFGPSVGFNVFEACSGWLHALGLPALAYALDALVLYTFGRCAWEAGRQLLLARKARKRLIRLADTNLTAELRRKFDSDGRDDIVVVADPAPLAFTIGFVSPLIVLSDALVRLLDDDELEAVVHHERFHRISRDPLKTFVLDLIGAVLPYVPILKWSSGQYRIARELLADRYAVQRTGTSEPLASALLKLIRSYRPVGVPFPHASFADTSVNYRMLQLVDPHAAMPPAPPLRPTVVSAHACALLTAAFVCLLH